MLPTITTALAGLLLLSNSSIADATSTSWTKVAPKEEPTYKSLTVLMSGYNALPGQTDDTPDVTASGTKPIPGVTAARSQDLAGELPYGTVIELVHTEKALASNGCGLSVLDGVEGYRVITDAMHPRKTNQIDLVFSTTRTVQHGGRELNRAQVFGLCDGMEVRIVGFIDLKDLPQSQGELKLALERSKRALAIDK